MSQVLEDARKKVQFNVKELSYIIWDSKEHYERLKKFQALIVSEPELRYDPSQLGLSREDLYNLYCRKTKRMLEVSPLEEIREFGTQCFPEALVGSLTFQMFIPTINNLGTPEQVKLFAEPAKRWEILGCYAQTEMAHGSDLNRLETTATFDKATQEFVINTPNLGATKWWASDMGLTATHAVAQAQLIIDKKSYGIQTFVVQLRDVKTHKVLPSIELGDIGAKFGFNSKDNGYIKFTNTRVPLVNMLSKYAKVSSEGVFTKTGNDKIWYATMQLQRQHFLDISWKVLGQALTIITRYSLQRTQFKDKEGIEIPIFNYQLQQAKIIPMMAEMFGNMYGSKKIRATANESVRRIQQNNDFSLMTEVHVLVSAAKAFYTWNTFFGLERIRQCAGGHGYSLYSGLPQLVTEFASCVAAEGDNTVLSLSVGKTLLSYLQESFKTGKAPNQTVDYLDNVMAYVANIKEIVKQKQDLTDPNNLRDVLRYTVAITVAQAGQKLQTLMGQRSLSFKEATDKHMGIILNEIARTQSNYWTLKTFIEGLNVINNKEIQVILRKVCVFYGLMKILETESQIFEFGILKSQHFKWVKEIRDELLPILKDQAIGLTEAFSYDDNSLRSAIGQHDGKVYETLFKWSSELNPVNDPAFQDELFQKIKVQRGIITGPRL